MKNSYQKQNTIKIPSDIYFSEEKLMINAAHQFTWLVGLGLAQWRSVCLRYPSVTIKLKEQCSSEMLRGQHSLKLKQMPIKSTTHCSEQMTYYKWDVHSSDDINFGVASRLLRHKNKSFGVQCINFGAILQESDIFPRSVFPVWKSHQPVSLEDFPF